MIGWPEDANIDSKIKDLLDIWVDKYPPGVERFYSREKAELMIRSIVWAYSCLPDQMAGIYAVQQLFDTIGLKDWTFSEDEAAALMRFRENRGIKSIRESSHLIDDYDCSISDLTTDGADDAVGTGDTDPGDADPI
jgi:hypothetical protein